MKSNWLIWAILVLVVCSVRLPAQQNEDASKHFEDVKSKAEQGDAIAQYNLGILYAFGRGATKDNVEAVKWFRKAAEQNDADAQYNLGVCYAKGKGVGQDSEEAIKWYRKSAEQGNVGAQYNLGVVYASGNGVPEDDAEAAKWFLKAAEQGDDQAQYNLGVMYASGSGVPNDDAEAAKWFQRAAEQGSAKAQLKLGSGFYVGIGVPKNLVESYKWFNLAAAHGDNEAAKTRDKISLEMTPTQIEEAQRLSHEFVSRKESGSSNSLSPANPTVTGTGFFIADDGYLISNYHVVKDATKVRLLTGAGSIEAKVVQFDAANDLALLKADGRFACLPIAASRTGLLGGTVATVGFPDIGLQGFAPKLAKGEIASLSGAGDDPRYFQISVPVQPGNSGGALVIGIVSAKLDASTALAMSGSLPENVNYAVKSSLLLSFLESVPEVDARLKAPNTADEKFEDVVKSAQDAAVLVLVY
jgi:hypothetical protein